MPETSHIPSFSPHAPQHLPHFLGGAAPHIPGTASLCSVIFPSLSSSACLSLSIPFSLHLLEKNVSTEENAIKSKEKWKEAPQTCYTGVFCARSRAKFCFHHTGEKSGLSPLELMAFLCKGNRISFIRALYSSRGAINPYGFQSRLPRFAAPASPAWEVPDHFLASFLDLSAHDKQHLVPIPNVQAH